MASGSAAPATGANAILFQSRDELRKQRDLEEARKSGLLPAEKDEEGRDINPHIPQYIAKAPWYLSQDHPSLKHQRFKEEPKISIEHWYKRGVAKERPKKFRAGACANCGAITHQAKDCTDRPRKIGARWTKSDMHADELIAKVDVDLGWDGKRDRWGGYDPNEYALTTRDYELAEVERKRRKQNEIQELLREVKSRRKKRKLRKRLSRLKDDEKPVEEAGEGGGTGAVATDGSREAVGAVTGGDGAAGDRGGDRGFEDHDDSDSDSGTDSDSDSDSEFGGTDDEDARIRDFDQTNAVVGSKDERTRTTTRNLRIREDTAKYLHNLDLDSAFYDPKTRSMRDNPTLHLKDEERGLYQGDNLSRHTGDAVGVAKLELFAWEAYKHGSNVHLQSMPTQLEKVFSQHLDKKEMIMEDKRDGLLSKYGGREHLGADNKEVLFSQTERYVEYERDGTLKKGKERSLAASKYEEDVYVGNHTSVWGSWYDMETHKWGFQCCRQTSKTSDCSATAVRVPNVVCSDNNTSVTAAAVHLTGAPPVAPPSDHSSSSAAPPAAAAE